MKMLILLALVSFLPTSCTTPSATAMGLRHRRASSSEPIQLSFLLTNDIHGHLSPHLGDLASITHQLRSRPEYQSEKAALFVLDSGDQFQGTLLSNFDEGTSIFKALNEIGYDAIIPGNHDYDFGPIGWLYDQVTPGKTSNQPREVIERLSESANFPMLSANTYLKKSILSGGKSIPLDDQCRPLQETPQKPLDFSAALRPQFLKPYVILKRAGVRVALIGIDNRSTTSTTTRENVSDLCFRDEVSAYLELRRTLEGQADVFVILMHNGDTDKAFEGSEIARKINASIQNGVHLVAAGHTHFIHNANVDGVRVMQDGANAKAYGRVDLYFDPNTKSILPERTHAGAGIPIDRFTCNSVDAGFACAQLNLPLPPNPALEAIVTAATDRVAPLASRKLGMATEKIWVTRIDESPLGNALADALRASTGTQVAFLNSGGIRTALLPGEIRYENLFEVVPFQNQTAVIQHLPWKTLKAALVSAIQTCGQYGTLVQSGLRVRFSRDCSNAAGSVDPNARLLHVETLDHTLLFDSGEKSVTAFEVQENYSLNVATLDFIAAGGSGYRMFAGTPIDAKPGIARELIADQWSKSPPTLNASIDQRFQNDHAE